MFLSRMKFFRCCFEKSIFSKMWVWCEHDQWEEGNRDLRIRQCEVCFVFFCWRKRQWPRSHMGERSSLVPSGELCMRHKQQVIRSVLFYFNLFSIVTACISRLLKDLFGSPPLDHTEKGRMWLISAGLYFRSPDPKKGSCWAWTSAYRSKKGWCSIFKT